jgi:antitoxin ParD1/3/4
MPLSLSAETERQIAERVESGQYESADEVVRHALQALSKEDEDYASRLEALRGKIQEGIDDLENGRYSPIDEVFARLRARRGMPLST